MGKTATLVLDATPTDERCGEIADRVAIECDWKEKVSWFLSDVVPPVIGYGVDVLDQFEAHKRDHPEATFMIVLMENYDD